MLVKTFCAAVMGLEAITVTVEINIDRGVMFHLSGLADTSIKESYDRIKAALTNIGFRMPISDITVNLSPADIRKEGSGYDLPLAIGILAADCKVESDRLKEYMLVGELGLDGSLRPIRGALPIAIRARKEHFRGLIVPHENVREAAVVNNLDVYGMDSLSDVVRFFNGSDEYQPEKIDTRAVFYQQQCQFDLDFADVKGQENVKRALEVAAAGGHNIIMVGPPGSGKSMMAKRLPSILPPLSLSESLETTQIHSVAGKLSRDTSLISQRPFRSPHHTISSVALVGGGTIIAAVPVCCILMDVLVLHERVTLKQVLCALGAIGGVALISVGGAMMVSALGMLFLVLTMLSDTLYYGISHSAAKRFTPFEMTYVMFIVGMVVFIPVGLIYAGGLHSPLITGPMHDGGFWVAVLYLGLLSSVLAYGLLNFANSHLSVSETSLFSNVTTVVSVLAGVVLLKEPFSVWQMLGVAVILVCVFVANVSGGKES